MEVIKKTLQLSREDYFKKHLLIINHILPIQMTPKEAEVLAAFMALEGDIASDPFGTTGRKIVRQKLNISAGGLGNYLDQFTTKQFVLGEGKDLRILPILIPKEKSQGYNFILQINDKL